MTRHMFVYNSRFTAGFYRLDTHAAISEFLFLFFVNWSIWLKQLWRSVGDLWFGSIAKGFPSSWFKGKRSYNPIRRLNSNRHHMLLYHLLSYIFQYGITQFIPYWRQKKHSFITIKKKIFFLYCFPI